MPITTTLHLDRMRAVHAVRALWTALGGIDGVTRADVTLSRAVVEHDAPVDAGAWREAVELAGGRLVWVETTARRLPTL